MNVSWAYLQKLLKNKDSQDTMKKKRKDAISNEMMQKIINFFHREDISRSDPSSTSASSKGKGSKYYMEKTVKETYHQFQKEFNNCIGISYSKFTMFRPKNVKKTDDSKLRNCCCEYCENVVLKKKAINNFLNANGHQQYNLGSKFQMAYMTCCETMPGSDLPSSPCFKRQCTNCGTTKVEEHLQSVLDVNGDTNVTWHEWRLGEQTYQSKLTGQETCTKKKMLVEETGTLSQLVTKLKQDLEPFALHIVNYQWQARQYAKLTEEIPKGWLVLVMDFGENYSCFYQDEAQGAHWARQQVTIHPVGAFYRCPVDNEVVQEAFICISNYLKHDSHAGHHFEKKAVEDLLKRGVEITKIIHFSDGCGSQYKGKTSFVDASFADIQTEKHFFGSRHGKGPCDREIGVVKRMVKQAVKSRRAVVATAEDLYAFGVENLSRPPTSNEHGHKRRTFIFVSSDDINCHRPERTEVQSVAGTRQLHCVRGIGQKYVIYTRERSCFCPTCIEGGKEELENISMCGKLKKVTVRLFKKRKDMTQSLPSPDAEGNLNLSSIVNELDLSNLEDQIASSSLLNDSQQFESIESMDPSEPKTNEGRNVPSTSMEPQDETGPTPCEIVEQASTIQSYNVGQYVEALLYGKGGVGHRFRGMIDHVFDNEVLVRFMKTVGGDIYTWPDIDDLSHVPVKDIISLLPCPSLISRGRYTF